MKNTGYSLSPIPIYFYVEKGTKLAGIPLGNSGLTRGSGDFKAVLDANNLKDSGYSLDRVKGIYIPLTAQVMLVSQWDDDEFRLADFIGLEDPASASQVSAAAASADSDSAKQVSDGNISANKASDGNASADKASDGNASANKVSVDKIPANPTSEGNSIGNNVSEKQGVTAGSSMDVSFGSMDDGTVSDKITAASQADETSIPDIPHPRSQMDALQPGNVPARQQANSTADLTPAASQDPPEEKTVHAQEETGGSPAQTARRPGRQHNEAPCPSAPADALKALEALPRPLEETSGFRTISGKNAQGFCQSQRERQASARKNALASSQTQRDALASGQNQRDALASGQSQRESQTAGNGQQARHTQADEPENWDLRWRFILENYPVMTPFAGDDRTLCVRMELKDLRQLPKQFWYFGNNSFLLHGFFNYRYFILGMTEEFGIKKWFIGVPGVFQNPERVMAALFGFPEFRSEKDSPINTGEFGYWYRYLNELSVPAKK